MIGAAMGASKLDRVAPRVPCFSPVIATGLRHCWMTNLSEGGMGLTAIVGDGTAPQPGDDLELEFELRDAPVPIRAVARIAWISRVREDGRIGLGVQFRNLPAHSRVQITTFLSNHRPRALVALASPEQQAFVRACLADLQLEIVEHFNNLTETTLHTCGAIIVFAERVEPLRQLLDAIHTFRTDSRLPIELPLAGVTAVTSVDSELLLPLFRAGKLYDVLRPPIEQRALLHAVQRSCERWALQMELRWASLQLEGTVIVQQRATKATGPAPSRNVICESDAMREVYDLIDTVAQHNVPVLLTGETGTGKELAARQIHARSKRADTPFVAQDCGALTETLLESELFGHVRGAFTGATADHPGLFQIADGGTIFLDEIQNTPHALQAKLLRVVETGEVRPVGGTKPRRVDVRLIAACNVDLREEVKHGRFRADFFYRLNRFPVELPPLREHLDDVIPLMRHFVRSTCEAFGRPECRVEPRVEAALIAYAWPGNIRELKNTIERSLLLTRPGDPLRWEALPEEVRSAQPLPVANEDGLDAQVAAFERRLIQNALDRNDGVVRRAARELEVNAVTLGRKMKKLGMDGRGDE